MEIRDIEILPDGRMDTVNAALYIGLSQKTLAMKRSAGNGPRFIKRGKIFYRKEDLDEWIAEGAGFKSTAQAQVANLNTKKLHKGKSNGS